MCFKIEGQNSSLIENGKRTGNHTLHFGRSSPHPVIPPDDGRNAIENITKNSLTESQLCWLKRIAHGLLDDPDASPRDYKQAWQVLPEVRRVSPADVGAASSFNNCREITWQESSGKWALVTGIFNRLFIAVQRLVPRSFVVTVAAVFGK